MIFDNIKNCILYSGVNSKFEKAFAFINRVFEENLEVGRYEIEGDDIYAMVQAYETKLETECRFEGHEKYIDIQVVVEGCEMIGVADISKAVPETDYNEEKDIAFYRNCQTASYCIAEAGDFLVLYPHDIHRPGMACDNIPENVKKVVVKVRV